MRLALIIAVVVATALAAMPAGAAAAASPRNRRAAVLSPKTQLLAYADEHSDVYKDFGGARQLHFLVGPVRCARDAAGAWRLQDARPADNVWKIAVEDTTVVARRPSVYEGACTDHFRDRRVRYDPARHAYRSKLSATYVRRADPACY